MESLHSGNSSQLKRQILLPTPFLIAFPTAKSQRSPWPVVTVIDVNTCTYAMPALYCCSYSILYMCSCLHIFLSFSQVPNWTDEHEFHNPFIHRSSQTAVSSCLQTFLPCIILCALCCYTGFIGSGLRLYSTFYYTNYLSLILKVPCPHHRQYKPYNYRLTNSLGISSKFYHSKVIHGASHVRKRCRSLVSLVGNTGRRFAYKRETQ